MANANKQSPSTTKPKRSPKRDKDLSSRDRTHSSKSISVSNLDFDSSTRIAPILNSEAALQFSQSLHSSQRSLSQSQSRSRSQSRSQFISNWGHSSEPVLTETSSIGHHRSSRNRRAHHKSKQQQQQQLNRPSSPHSLKKSNSEPALKRNRKKSSSRKSDGKGSKRSTNFLDLPEKSDPAAKSYKDKRSGSRDSSTADLYSNNGSFSVDDNNNNNINAKGHHRGMSNSNSPKEKPEKQRRKSRSASPKGLIESTTSSDRRTRQKSKASGGSSQSNDQRRRRERGSHSRSHSPVGRNSSSKSKKKKHGLSATSHELGRSKSDSSLDVSKHMEENGREPVEFNDDTDIGTKKKRRGRRQKSKAAGDMESELAQMLNGGSGTTGEGPLKDHDAATMDMTVNSKASTKSGRSRKNKKRPSKQQHGNSTLDKSTGTKSDEGESEDDVDDGEELPPLPNNSAKVPKRTKSTRSSVSKSSDKNKRKGKKSSKDKDGASRSSRSMGMAEDESSKKKPKPRRRSSKTPFLVAEDVPPPPPSSATPNSATKKKKKRSSTKSPTQSKALLPASNHTKSLPVASNHSFSRLDASGKSAIRPKRSGLNADPPGTTVVDDKNKTPSPGTLRRAKSLNPETTATLAVSPAALRRSTSDMDALTAPGSRSSAGGGNNRIKNKARSLFGAVLNPNAKGAETVGDGDNSDNEYEVKPAKEASKKGLLGWAKKKMQPMSPKYSPGHYRNRLTKGFKMTGGSKSGDDQQGLLSNSDDRGGPMSLLDLRVPDPDPDRPGLLGSVGEDNTIEESNSFRVPKSGTNPAYNYSNSANLSAPQPPPTPTPLIQPKPQQRRAHQRGSITSSIDGDKPPFSQIISTADLTTDDDELSDIGDPEANIVPLDAMQPEMRNGVEIIFDPERNDIVYDDRGHPGTIRMIHIMREILMERQDDIEYSPEVYKVVKRRLKGRKFLLRARHSQRTAWREATKAENVQLLADFFHEEMRQLFGGSINMNDKVYDEEIDQSVSGSPEKQAKKRAMQSRRNSGTISNGYASMDGSRVSMGPNKYMQRAIAECKWAQEIAKPMGDIETMNVGIDAEEKLIALIEIADQGSVALEPLKEELDKLGELAKQMMYVSIAPLFERLEEIEENMADYFEQEEIFLAHQEDDIEDDDEYDDRSRSPSYRDRSMEKDGEMYEIAMKSASFEDEDLNLFDEVERDEAQEDDEEDFHEVNEEEDDHDHDEGLDEEYDEESDEESGTSVKEGELLKCDNTDPGDVSSVGESGIYDESESDDDDSDLEDGEKPDWVDFGDDDDDEEDDDDSHTHAGTNSSDEDSELSDEPLKRKKSVFDEPNPKLKQFFDRLNHFFETRKRIEECAAKIDPGNKCRKIKAKAHSGGIAKKAGGYKKEFQQRDINDRIVRNLDDLYTAAETAYPDFKSIVQQIGDDISGLDFKKNVILPQLKSREKAYEKAKTEYGSRDPGPPESWLYDICRAGIVCNTIKQLSEVSKWITSNTHVVQAKNRFLDPVFNGYRDLLYHVSIPYQDGNAHICEIQVHLKDIYVMNDQCGTIKHYDFFRSDFSNPWRSQEDTLFDLQKMNKYTKIEGPFMKKLLKSEDTEQLLFFAVIFRNKIEEYDRSLELYRRVLGLQEDAHGSDNEEMADTYLSIGLVLGAMGDTEESLQNLLKALAIQESFLGADHIEVADSYVEIGHMLSKRGDYSGAYTQYLRTQVIRESKLGKEHFLVIKSLQDIGLVLQKKGDLLESETEYRKALAIQEDVLGEGHSDLALTHSFIGKTLCLYGDFEKAMVEHQLALSIREKVFGKNHRLTAESHTAIGVLLFHKGDYKMSRWHHHRALKIRESMLGKGDQECAISHRHLGEVLSDFEGDYEGAVKELKKAQEILEANVGRDHPVTAESYVGLGHIHCQHGKYEEALAEYRRAKVIMESNLGQTHPETAVTYMYTGNALNLAGNHDGALQMHRKALVVFESVLGSSHPRTADGYHSTAMVYEASGHPEMALSEYREALKIKKNALRKDHPSIAELSACVGKILLNCCDSKGNTGKRDTRRALDIFREVLATTEERCGKDHPAAALARYDVSIALTMLAEEEDGDAEPRLLSEAEGKLQDSLQTLREVEPLGDAKPTKSFFLGFGEEAAITGRACVALGTVLVKKGNDEEAKDMFVEGLERLIKVLGGDHPDTLEAESKLLSFVAES